MKTIWFKKIGWFYLPVHFIGYLLCLLAIVLLLVVCMLIVRYGQTDTSSLLLIFLYASCIAFWWKWVAKNTSE